MSIPEDLSRCPLLLMISLDVYSGRTPWMSFKSVISVKSHFYQSVISNSQWDLSRCLLQKTSLDVLCSRSAISHSCQIQSVTWPSHICPHMSQWDFSIPEDLSRYHPLLMTFLDFSLLLSSKGRRRWTVLWWVSDHPHIQLIDLSRCLFQKTSLDVLHSS